MRRGTAWKALSFLIWVVLVSAISAHAAEEGSAANTERANDIFKWINFAIVAGLIGWVFLKLTPPFFRRNAETISSAIAKSMVAKAEADRHFRDAEERLTKLGQEVAQMRSTAQREMSAESDRLKGITQSDIQKVGQAAKAEIEAAERAARLELKVITANLAVDGAESLLTKELTPQAQESLVSSFVKSLEGRPN